MIPLYRAQDAVLTLCQNNLKQAIEIFGSNEAARNLLGYSEREFEGFPLQKVLSDEIASTIADYVEYEEGGNDISTVLRRVKDFKLKSREGKVLPMKLKVVRTESIDGQGWFRLIMQQEDLPSEMQSLLALLQQNFKGHEILDESLELPERTSLIKNVDLLKSYATTHHLKACFAVIDVDDYTGLLDSYSKPFCIKLLKHVATLCKQKLRAHDAIGTLSPSSLGLILLDITPDSARLVLNRLRWLVASQPFSQTGQKKISITVSVSFGEITAECAAQHFIAECEHALAALQHEGGNMITEVMHMAEDIKVQKMLKN